MNRCISRQPTFRYKENHYIEGTASDGIRGICCYAFIPQKDILLIPNDCVELLWNVEQQTLYTFSYLQKYCRFPTDGQPIFGIHIDSSYLFDYREQELKQWLANIHGLLSQTQLNYCSRQLGKKVTVRLVHPLVRQAIEQIRETKGRLVVETIAEDFGYSPRQLERLFREIFSYGPKQFCRHTRLLNAIASMQERPDKSLSYHIKSLGYSDQSHFQREFKYYTGMTPRQFIKEYVESG